ncbi:MAG TPA: squalene/phytoene synthase family protein [Bryobacteraceae bacterium]
MAARSWSATSWPTCTARQSIDAGCVYGRGKPGDRLQLTNFCRDVAEDWKRGRIYIPSDVLTAHGWRVE